MKIDNNVSRAAYQHNLDIEWCKAVALAIVRVAARGTKFKPSTHNVHYDTADGIAYGTLAAGENGTGIPECYHERAVSVYPCGDGTVLLEFYDTDSVLIEQIEVSDEETPASIAADYGWLLADCAEERATNQGAHHVR